jgi:hypothetical protein
MSKDTIYRQDAIDALIRKMRPQDNGDGTMVVYIMSGRLVEETLNDLPSAQPEIIRCKDCRWRKDQSGSTAWLPCRAIVTPSDFYCGRAERRTDGCR